jgi:rod shape-determining protein MreD
MRRSDDRQNRLAILATVAAGLVLAIVPLPTLLDRMRPDFLLLLVVYWTLKAPRSAGLLFAWLCGFALDVLKGTLLGQHALGFVLVAFLTHRVQLRLRIFPIWQQAVTVLMMVALYQFLVFWIDGITGHAVTSWQRWLPIATGGLIWPLLVAVVDSLVRNRR